MTNVVIAVLIIALFWYVTRTEHFDVVSPRDQRTYPVLGGFQDMSEAANRLADINDKNVRLIRYLVEKYGASGDTHGSVLAMRLQTRYRPDRLEENDPVDKYNTSFTENKGTKVAMCLREKVTGNNRLHDRSILEFVDLHEMAHIASEGYGHDDEFWSNFKFLLDEANAAGLHKPVNYADRPINYCGLDVMYNPYFDR